VIDLGDRARYPLKLRPDGLVTASIVVAVLRKEKRSQTSRLCFSFFLHNKSRALSVDLPNPTLVYTTRKWQLLN